MGVRADVEGEDAIAGKRLADGVDRLVGREAGARRAKRPLEALPLLPGRLGRPVMGERVEAGEMLQRGVEVADHLVRDHHAAIGVDRIDVHGQDGNLADPRLVLHLDDVVAQREDEVGAAEELSLHLPARPLDASDGQRMLLVDEPLGHGRGREGQAVALDDLAEEIGIPQPHRGGPHHRHRPPRRPEQLGGPLHRALRRRGKPAPDGNRRDVLGRGSEGDVLGEIEVYGSRRFAERHLQRLGQDGGHAPAPEGEAGLGDRPEQRVVIDGHLDAAPQLRRGEIARDGQQRRAVEKGVAHARGEVRRAGAEGGDAKARGAGEPPHDVGGEAGRTLMRGQHERQIARAHRFHQAATRSRSGCRSHG